MTRDGEAILATAYRYFLAVAEAGSMRAASRDLNIASSAVNRQILLLEEAIGMRLFERTGRRLVLTETGKLLLGHVRDTALGYGDVMSSIDAIRGIRSGRIRIAVVESIATSLLPGIVAAFQERYREIKFSISVYGSEEVAHMVLAREADVGLTFNATQIQGLDVVLRASLQIGAIVRAQHPLASREAVSLAQCHDFPVAYPARNLSIRKLLDDALRGQKIAQGAAMEMNSLNVMSAMARSGDCIAFQTRVGIERDLADGSLVFLPLLDKSLTRNEFQLVRRAGRENSPATQAFIDHAKPILEKRLPE